MVEEQLETEEHVVHVRAHVQHAHTHAENMLDTRPIQLKLN